MIDEELLRQEYERGFVDGMGCKKKWVGLTNEEIDELHGSPMDLEHSGSLEWVRVIESKLKEKNACGNL